MTPRSLWTKYNVKDTARVQVPSYLPWGGPQRPPLQHFCNATESFLHGSHRIRYPMGGRESNANAWSRNTAITLLIVAPRYTKRKIKRI